MVFIERKTVERQKERECVRDRALLEMRGSVSNKKDRLEKIFVVDV
jgi:hypothetical protein